MRRTELILKGIAKSDRGLEIAPWHKPLAPKRDGWNVTTIDVFDTPTLLEKAKRDPNVREDLIEEVDYVMSACDVGNLDEQFDYIISSHNFEHLPNPIKFLQGVGKVLKPGGLLTMAVPDCRYTFDRYRPRTTTGEWLEAHEEGRVWPSPRQIFDNAAYFSENGELPPLPNFVTGQVDTHCSTFSPASLELMLIETQMMGLSPLSIESISKTRPSKEFFVRLRNAPAKHRDREDVIRRVHREHSARRPLHFTLAELVTSLTRRL